MKIPIPRMLLCALLLCTTFATSHAEDAGPQTVADRCPFLSSGILESALTADLPDNTILKSGDLEITPKDLEAEIRKSPKELWPELKRNLFFVLENRVAHDLIAWEADSWAKTQDDAPADSDSRIRAYLESLGDEITVSDEEAKTFFDQNQDMMGGAKFDEVREQLKTYLLGQKREQIIQEHISRVGSSYDITVDEAWLTKQCAAASDNPVDQARKSGMPSLVDFGADGCRPCEMMTPILDEMKKTYAGKLNVVFVHVRKEQILAARYGVRSIPVQVFFDKDGNEVFRHVGFYPKDKIEEKLAQMGVK